MRIIKNILVYICLIVSVPFSIVSIIDYCRSKASIDIFIFVIFILPAIFSCKYLLKSCIKSMRSKKTPIENEFKKKSIDSSVTPTSIPVSSSVSYDCMEGHDFEYFCASILEKNKFVNVEVTRGSGDQGIDILAYKDGIKYGIQCKCYSSDIGNKAVQEVIAGKNFYDCHVGVVLTNRYFTKSAKELAEKTGILLWDRLYLEKLINNFGD